MTMIYHSQWQKRNELEYYELLALQNYACGICGSETRELVVDHDHNTRMIRGLICRPCNAKLNKYNETWIMNAMDYLRRATNRELVD